MSCLGQAPWKGISKYYKVKLYNSFLLDQLTAESISNSLTCAFKIQFICIPTIVKQKEVPGLIFLDTYWHSSPQEKYPKDPLFCMALLFCCWCEMWFIWVSLSILAEVRGEDNYYVQMYIEHSLWDISLSNFHKKKKNC